MTIQRMVELLEIEHECILRNSHDACDRNCADCDLVQDDGELHEMYTDVIALLKEQEAVKPERHFARHSTKPYGMEFWYTCGSCGTEIRKNDKFCHECGRAVNQKW